MAKNVVEFIGTFFLVFTIGMVVLDPGVPAGFAPIAIGTVLAVMIFAGGHVSGGHFNPAVTLGVFLRDKKFGMNDAIGYWVAQIVGGLVAALAVIFLKGGGGGGMSVEVVPALLAEFIFTFALVYVVLNVATAKGTSGNSFYGWAIGSTVLVGAYAVGGISGGAFNPAVAIGASLMGALSWGNIWIYLVANLAAGAAAAYAFKYTHPGE
ncbi:MAG: aquaporin [Caldilineaceae bacterium]|nr:aquaporin [Caldilineaceae bacterium]MBP8107399.1 aquaporin [Caldilineaceae bacterium]MBP8124712.1 aquaporin [Caldilineaceae bacterium]MBP9070942.1 aquaporin [Caldilineaceae bacterium]